MRVLASEPFGAENMLVSPPRSTPWCSTQQAPSYARWVSVRTFCQVKGMFSETLKLLNSFAKIIDGLLNKIQHVKYKNKLNWYSKVGYSIGAGEHFRIQSLNSSSSTYDESLG